MKNLTCTSKRDVVELVTLGYVVFWPKDCIILCPNLTTYLTQLIFQIVLMKYLPWIVQSIRFLKFFSIFPKNDSTDLGSLKDKLICNLEIMLSESKLSKTVVS